jgi:hypothetical protein
MSQIVRCHMDLSPDGEIKSTPPVATPYYIPAIPAYGPMFLPDPAVASQYGYQMPFMGSGAVNGTLAPPFQDPKEVMSLIPTLRCWSCSKCGNLNYAHRLTCNLRKCQRIDNGEADWMCACGNVNYRFRKYCNLRKCQLPQIGNPYLFYGIHHLIRNGYSSQAALSLLLTNGGAGHENDWQRQPDSNDGCWQCVGCGNLNFPWKDSCHRKSCNHPKPSTTL